MKQNLSKVGFRLRALRQSRHWTQACLAAACQQKGFPVSRCQLARYEVGIADVPARFIPIIAYALKADIADLLPPIGGQSESKPALTLARIRNLTGQQIQVFRRNRKWSQSKLAGVIRTMGAPMTREIIANLETRRTRVKDYDLVLVAKALQIPMDSLFPGEARAINFPDAFNNNPQSQNPLETRRRNGQLNPFTRMARKIGKFAKRFITRRKKS
jgi:transcriptional regulator with XRE-family HTH domain